MLSTHHHHHHSLKLTRVLPKTPNGLYAIQSEQQIEVCFQNKSSTVECFKCKCCGSYRESNWCQILKEYPCSLINSHITIWRSWSYKNRMNDVDPTTVKVIVGRWPCIALSHEYAGFSVKKKLPIPTGKHTPTWWCWSRAVNRQNDTFDTFLLFVCTVIIVMHSHQINCTPTHQLKEIQIYTRNND